ncbi:DNA adenine methylase [Metaclostridioides mangenotii]|uniref:DNA adenine methylase n=1 Tax=Metaclostridioides mangenotii TaxID=1540 RepID=UPI0004668AD6|nr:DNA adenine methylase [Clostridioides mangenotii]
MKIEEKIKLTPPCSYQGGKQKLAKKIVDTIFEQNGINKDTQFYDLCCGSGAITLELINRGIDPNNITMVDKSDYGHFWLSVGNDEFNIEEFENVISQVPDKPLRKNYLKQLSQDFKSEKRDYHHLLLQSGSFGGKALWSENNKWKHHGFRDYWMPTETSVRRSPCNPTRPDPEVMLERVKNIIKYCSGKVKCFNQDVIEFLKNVQIDNNSIVYIDPPYIGTTGYNTDLDAIEAVNLINKDIPIYVSECNILSNKYVHITKGKSKGNITGVVKNKRKDDLLNIFN